MAVANAWQERCARGSPNFPIDTLTELSHAEGSALRQYGQLPYGKPTEWGRLQSHDNLLTAPPPRDVKPHFVERAKSLRKSLSVTRPKSLRRLKSLKKSSLFSSAGTLTESPNETEARTSFSKEGIPVSAVEGALELPTETTPRQTPDREDDRGSLDLNMRPISSVWPSIPPRKHTSLFPVFEDRDEFRPPIRVRGSSITTQSPGAVPNHPPPPPPVAYPPNRFALSHDDSVMRLSSLSLETADSSILDDSMAVSTTDGELASPALPPCPTFAPYSADDVGRDYHWGNHAGSRASLPTSSAFPTNSTLSDMLPHEPPRRSRTAHSPSYNSIHSSTPPRRSESVYTAPSGKESRYGSHLRPFRQDSGLLPYFSQFQHNPPINVPFHGGPAHRSSINSYEVHSRTASFVAQDTPQQTSEQPRRGPLHSALKGGNGSRKGHRRQNCVRISIHPPITFEGSRFPPTFEEEEQEEPDAKPQAFNLSTSNVPSPNSDISPVSMNTPSSERQATVARDPHYSPRTPTKKRKHERTDSDIFSSGNSKDLPNIFTSLPSGDATLSSTPSSGKGIPAWPLSNNSSPATHENMSMGSPRRSAVKGPRSQPRRKSGVNRSPAPLGESLASTPAGSPSRLPRSTTDPRKSSDGQDNSIAGEVSSTPHSGSRTDSRRVSMVQGSSPGASARKSTSVNNNGDSLTIWEDVNAQRTPTKKSPSVRDTVIELERLSPRKSGRSKSSPRPRKLQKSPRQMPRQEFTTPTRHRYGLGIEAAASATPGSLYDHDGFLKEFSSRFA